MNREEQKRENRGGVERGAKGNWRGTKKIQRRKRESTGRRE
jgi:hypothetical protein